MSLEACAALVERGDPDRFRVAMAAPPAAREILFALYAFNLEVARAPWVTKEPMLAEMRLQWWRDQVEASAAGMFPPSHEVAGPLGHLLRDRRLDPAPLDAMVEARRRDIEAQPFAAPELRSYLEGTAGNLLWASAKALGAPEDTRDAVLQAGFASGLASWLQALPELTSRNRGFVEQEASVVSSLCGEALRGLKEARRARFGPAVPAMRAASLAGPVLRIAEADPEAAIQGRLALPEGRKRLRILWLALSGRW